MSDSMIEYLPDGVPVPSGDLDPYRLAEWWMTLQDRPALLVLLLGCVSLLAATRPAAGEVGR